MTPLILAIDPGPKRSAWLVLQGGVPAAHAITENDELLRCLRVATLPDGLLCRPDVVAIEQIEPRYGLSPGWETLDTARIVGRLEEAVHPVPATRLKRSEILRHLGVVTRGPGKTSADAGVRAALLDRFGGRDEAIGRKAHPGPLYGVANDVWAALSVAISYADGVR